MDEMRTNHYDSEKINNVKGYYNPVKSILDFLMKLSLISFGLFAVLFMLSAFSKLIYLKISGISLLMWPVSMVLSGISKSMEKEKRIYISCSGSRIMVESSNDGYYEKASVYRAAGFGTYTKNLTLHTKEKCGLGCRHISFYDKNSDTVRIKTYLENHGALVKEFDDKPADDD